MSKGKGETKDQEAAKAAEQVPAAEVGIQQRLEAKLDQALREIGVLRAELKELREWNRRMARKGGIIG